MKNPNIHRLARELIESPAFEISVLPPEMRLSQRYVGHDIARCKSFFVA
jgi:hypothetical protein